MNFDGKKGFIGCEEYRDGTPRCHRFMTIPCDVKESLLIKLFCTDNGDSGSFRFLDSPSETPKCARVVPCWNGAKGKQLCHEWPTLLPTLLLNSTANQFTAAYTHMNNGKVIQGRLIQRKCSSKIKIYSPIDRTD